MYICPSMNEERGKHLSHKINGYRHLVVLWPDLSATSDARAAAWCIRAGANASEHSRAEDLAKGCQDVGP